MMCQRYMPKRVWDLIDAVGPDDLRQPGVRRGEFLVLLGLLVLEIVGAAEIILGARAADGGELAVAIHVRT